MAEGFCSEAGSKPATSSSCEGSGCVYQYYCYNITGGTVAQATPCSTNIVWGACSATCGTGTRTRAVTAVCLNQNKVQSSTACAALTPPVLSESCRATSACAWGCQATSSDAVEACTATGPWGACSEQCGTGVNTRVVTCRNGTGATVLDETLCVDGAGTKPATSGSCLLRQCQFVWHCYANGAAVTSAVPCTTESSWSACGTTCGTSTQSRQTVCLDSVTREQGTCQVRLERNSA